MRIYTLRNNLEAAEFTLMEGPHPERARLDSESLVMHLLGKDRAWLMAHPRKELSEERQTQYEALVARRVAGEPIQYITGETEFYGLPFRVTRDVLIPRPETEHLVEKVIELAGSWPHPRVVDVGTGSGAIAVALAAKLADATITAIDASAAALDVARKNAARNDVANRIRFLEGEWLSPVEKEQFEIVVSNPPYVAESDRETLAAEVREFEPALALFAGDDGLTAYREVIPEARTVLVEGGWIALEIGFGQEAAVRALLVESGFEEIGFTEDLQGIKRVAHARRA